MIRMMEAAGRGHLASALSVVEILRVLYDDVLKVDPENPRWAKRDRLILSKGHGCMSLYAILADKGFFPKSELDLFCKAEGILGGLWRRVRHEPENFLDGRTVDEEGVDAAAGDFIAGMTDRYAVELYQRLFIPKPWVGVR